MSKGSMSACDPFISVIVPVYKQEKYLPQALDSILSQSHKNLEIIVIVDGPSDEIGDIEERYPLVRFYHQPNSGIAAARNKGVKLAKGELVSFLDADDWMEISKLSRQLKYFLDDPRLECCLCSVRNFLDPDAANTDWFPSDKLGVSQIFITGMLVKMEVFTKYGLFNCDFPAGEDIEWLSFAQNKGLKWCVAYDAVINRRIHERNSTKNSAIYNKALVKILWNSVRSKKSPTVSVVIPAYNPSTFLNDAIQSALDQTLQPVEIIVVDDGSEVDVSTLISVHSPLIKVIRVPHQGTAACRNIGVKAAKAEFIAFFDADDIAVSSRLEVQTTSLLRSYNSLISFCALKEFLSPEYQSAGMNLRTGVASTSGTLLASWTAFEKVGPFNEDLKLAYFMDWIQRARLLGIGEQRLKDILVKRRIHSNNTSRMFPAQMKTEYLKVIRSNFAMKAL